MLEGGSAARVPGCRRTTVAAEQQHDFDEAVWCLPVACVECLDELMGELLTFFVEIVRSATVVMRSDHDECFGEQGFYGHLRL